MAFIAQVFITVLPGTAKRRPLARRKMAQVGCHNSYIYNDYFTAVACIIMPVPRVYPIIEDVILSFDSLPSSRTLVKGTPNAKKSTEPLSLHLELTFTLPPVTSVTNVPDEFLDLHDDLLATMLPDEFTLNLHRSTCGEITPVVSTDIVYVYHVPAKSD